MAVAVQVLAVAVVFVLMFTVGLSLSRSAVARLAAAPGRMVVLLAGQVTLVPLVGVGVAVALDAAVGKETRAGTPVATWVLLLASCPGGAISNALVLYGRGDVALSVAMTAASSVLAVITMPIVLVAFVATGMLPELITPSGTLFLMATLLLLTPCLAGAMVRARRPETAQRMIGGAGRAGTAMLLAALGLGIAANWQTVEDCWWAAVAAALAFVVGGGVIGGLLAAAAGLDGGGRFAVATEFGVRNVAAALAVATISLDGSGFAGFGAIYLVIEVGAIAAIAHRRRTASARIV